MIFEKNSNFRIPFRLSIENEEVHTFEYILFEMILNEKSEVLRHTPSFFILNAKS